MVVAHQGLESKPLPGLAPTPERPGARVAAAAPIAPPDLTRPGRLPKRATAVLQEVEHLMRAAIAARTAAGSPPAPGKQAMGASAPRVTASNELATAPFGR
jgi:penicillin-binding protein 1A